MKDRSKGDRPEDSRPEKPVKPTMGYDHEGVGCCTWTQGGVQYQEDMSRSQCDAVGGTWSPQPCA